MATARMRKTFAYPDSDNDSEPEGIDEEEQEQLIAQFIEDDARKTENYKVHSAYYCAVCILCANNQQ